MLLSVNLMQWLTLTVILACCKAGYACHRLVLSRLLYIAEASAAAKAEKAPSASNQPQETKGLTSTGWLMSIFLLLCNTHRINNAQAARLHLALLNILM